MDETAFLDRVRIEHLRALGGPALVARLIDLFLERTPGRIAEARAAHEARDWAGVGQAVHALISSAGNLGAAGLERLSREIERHAEEGLAAPIPSLVRELQGGYERLRPRLEEARRGLST